MPRTNRAQRLKPGERRHVVAWEVFADVSVKGSPWYDPALPTILIQYVPKANRKTILRDIGIALTTKLEREDQSEKGYLAIKIHALSQYPETAADRLRAEPILRKSIREIEAGRRSKDADGIDLLKLYKWRLWWYETKIRPPSDRDIAEQLKKQFGITVTRDQVKNIRSRDYRDWFHPEDIVWVQRGPIRHQRGLRAK